MTLNGDLPHIVAFNTWQGEGAPPPPANSLGMRYFEVVLPDQAELSRVIECVAQGGMATEQTAGGALVRDPSYQIPMITICVAHTIALGSQSTVMQRQSD